MKILLVAAPYDSGHHRQRLGLGPAKLLNGLAEHLAKKGHQIRKEEITITTDFPTEVTTSFEVSRKIAQQVRIGKDKGEFPIVLSGNCNTAALGTLSGLNNGSGVIWFDCHGDYNTPETTIGGFLDGMALSMVTGQCWAQLTASVPGFKPVDEQNIILVGARDLDPLEVKRISHSGITFISPEMLKENAVRDRLIPMESVYLHIDLDVLDPDPVQVNTYSTPGGISPDELCRAVELIKSKYHVSSVAFTAYDPSMDAQGKVPEVVNAVAEIVI